MKLLAPLGLLGLIGIIILIIIYIIKPNFQQKNVSSTYIWKLSLKYKKKRIPINNLRNFLLILCQILILSLCAFLLAQPNKVLKEQVSEREVIAIIDSSASMRTQKDDYTRFERAADKVLRLSDEVFSQNGIVSVIVADNNPSYLVTRKTKDEQEEVTSKVKALADRETDSCSFGVSDVEGAIALCEEVLVENPSAKIYFFTDSDYSFVPSSITVENVADKEEWNVAILDARAEKEENYYAFYVDVACYGLSAEIEVEIEVGGANALDKNDSGASYVYKSVVTCPDGKKQTLVFKYLTGEDDVLSQENLTVCPIEDALFSYKKVSIRVNEEDSLEYDNLFYIYGGQKEPIRIQYASLLPNPFVPSTIYVIKSFMAETRDVILDEVKQGEEPASEGYDLYIYEHKMPESLPTDGAVLLMNPMSPSADCGFSVYNDSDGSFDFHGQMVPLNEEMPHETIKGVTADKITISRYIKIISHDPGYEEILSVNGDPVFLVKNEGNKKIAVLSFNIHFSNLGISPEFVMIMKNLINYFMPSVVDGNAFVVNEKIELNTRGEEMYVTGIEEAIVSFPATIELVLPGTYEISQTSYFGKPISETIFARIAEEESNIRATLEVMPDPYGTSSTTDFYLDLLVYFALALVVIEFIEWFLQSREGM